MKLYAEVSDVLREPHTSGFDPVDTGTPMPGSVVAPEGIDSEEELQGRLARGLAALPAGAKTMAKK